MPLFAKLINKNYQVIRRKEKLCTKYCAIFVMLTRIHRVMHTMQRCFLCTLHAIERRAGISRGMNIDEHTSISTLSLIESSSSTPITYIDIHIR